MAAVGKMVLFVIAPQYFRDEELFHSKEELEKAGAQTAIASTSLNEARGMLGATAKLDVVLNEAKEENFDAIVFVGGSGASVFFNDAKAQALAKSFAAAGKVVAAICIAPSILANAGLLKGKRATCFPSEAANLKAKGAVFTGKPVEIDGNIVTASGPKAAREFGKKIASLL